MTVKVLSLRFVLSASLLIALLILASMSGSAIAFGPGYFTPFQHLIPTTKAAIGIYTFEPLSSVQVAQVSVSRTRAISAARGELTANFAATTNHASQVYVSLGALSEPRSVPTFQHVPVYVVTFVPVTAHASRTLIVPRTTRTAIAYIFVSARTGRSLGGIENFALPR